MRLQGAAVGMNGRFFRFAALLFLVMSAVFHVSAVSAHGGGLDKNGCHNDRKNGGYHCHRAPSGNAAPARSAASAFDGGAAADSRVFRNCDEARAHGAAPVRRGDPGYGPHLDRDNDGVGCEPYHGK